MTSSGRRAWIGLGGNIGDVVANMTKAVALLDQQPEILLFAVSPLYATPPWGNVDQPEFRNSCIEVCTSLGPKDLLETCLSVEKRLRRKRDVRWGPRTIDLDILAMEGIEFSEEGLTVPHARLTERAFALLPLCDLAPHLAIGGRTAAQWLSQVDAEGIRKVADGSWYRVQSS